MKNHFVNHIKIWLAFILIFGGIALGSKGFYSLTNENIKKNQIIEEASLNEKGIRVVSRFQVDQYGRVMVIHDDERNATCWISHDGISCIKDSK